MLEAPRARSSKLLLGAVHMAVMLEQKPTKWWDSLQECRRGTKIWKPGSYF